MKAGLIVVVVVVALVVFLALRSDPLQVRLEGEELKIYNKKCHMELPVRLIEKESDMVDLLSIDRLLLESGGVRFYLERDDLPPKNAFDKPYIEIVEKIFDTRFKEIFSGDGMAIYRGDFDVALFFKTRHNLVLLYPLNPEASDAIVACAKGEERGLRLKQMPLRKTHWKPQFFILDGFINKDI